LATWKVQFALGGTQNEEIELVDAETLVDWDPEFKGELISGFFDTKYTWISSLQSVSRDTITFPSKNFLIVVGRKWGESKTKAVPLGVLFEFTEGDLRLRAVGPKSLSEKTSVDGGNQLLSLVSDLFDKPNLWKTKIVIHTMPKSEWKVIADIVGEEPWPLLEQGRNIMKSDPKRAMENFSKAYKIFDILANVNGKFHAVFAQAELSLETKNFDLTKNRVKIVWELASQLGDPMLEENVLTLEGILLYENNLYTEAIARFEQALLRSKKANIHKAVVNAYCNIGECYYRVGMIDEAENNFEKARVLAQERNDKYWLAVSEVNLSKVLAENIKRGDSSSATQAIYYLEESVQLFEQLGDKFGLMIAQGSFGDLEAMGNNLEKALIHFEIASEKAQSLNDHIYQEYYQQKVQEMKNRLIDTL
jgi:tetratricopeptide (TPR) repeat protein